MGIKGKLVDRFYAANDCLEAGLVSADLRDVCYDVAAQCFDMATALQTSPNCAGGAWLWFDNMGESFNRLGDMVARAAGVPAE